MLLDHILSNTKNKAALVRLCEDGRLPHAVLLEGERGSGRFTLAKAIAGMAVCRQTPAGCGVCPDCRMAMQEIHPDIEVYAKEGATGNLTIKSLRTINSSVATPPVQGRRRVVILRDIQDASQIRTLNTLLKVIEEPPDYLMFVLTADNREHLLPTILSRCLLLRMELPEISECAHQAAKLLGQDEADEKILKMAQLCGGNIGRTVSLLSDTAAAKILEDAQNMAQAVLQGDRYSLMCSLSRYERDRAGYRELVANLREVFGRMVRARFDTGSSDASEPRRLSTGQILKILDVLDAACEEGQYNVNLPLALTCLGARLIDAVYG